MYKQSRLGDEIQLRWWCLLFVTIYVNDALGGDFFVLYMCYAMPTFDPCGKHVKYVAIRCATHSVFVKCFSQVFCIFFSGLHSPTANILCKRTNLIKIVSKMGFSSFRI